MPLASWLDDYRCANTPNDPDDPLEPVSDTPQNESQKISLKALRAKQHLLDRLNQDPAAVVGTQGEVFGGASKATYVITAAEGHALGTEFTVRFPITVGPAPDPRFNGPGGTATIPQAGDFMRFLPPCILSLTAEPRVVRSGDYDAGTNTFKIIADQDLASAVWKSTDGTQPTLTEVTVEVWRQSSRPKFNRIDAPQQMGISDTERFIELADLDEAKSYEIGAYPVLPPHADSFEAEGWNGTAWIDIAAEFIQPTTSARVVNRSFADGTYSSRIYFGADGYEGREHSSDLTATYSQFRLTLRRLKPGGSGYCFPFCKFARIDHNGTADNWAAPNGTGRLSEQTHSYCAKRQEWNGSEWVQPTGLSSGDGFPQDRRCLKYGSCDKWEPVEGAGVELEPFSISDTFSRAYRQLWCATHIRVDLPPGPGALYSISFVECPSLYWLLGTTYSLTSPSGSHTATFFIPAPEYGAITTETDPDTDDQNFRIDRGAYWSDQTDWTGYTFGTTYPAAGRIPANVTDLATQSDPVSGAALDSIRDPHGDKRRHPFRCGWGLGKDTGHYVGRGYQYYVRPSPNLEFELSNVTVDPGISGSDSFEWERYETPQAFAGQSTGGVLRIGELQPGGCAWKEALAKGSGTVKEVGEVSPGLYYVELENVSHSYLYTVSVGEDIVGTYTAGGNPSLCLPPDFNRPNDYYAGNKQLGDSTAVLGPGDTIAFLGTFGGQDWSDCRFLVDAVLPHSGEAVGYTGVTPADGWTPDGAYSTYADRCDRIRFYDDSGLIDFAGPEALIGATVTGYWNAGVFLPGLSLEARIGGAWVSVGSANYIPEHGRGNVHVLESYLSANPTITGWRIT